jgi:hypothetical protein
LPYHQTEIEDINVSYSPNNADNSKHARRLSLIIQHFWNRRKSEYLTPLRELHKKHGDNKINIKVGDTVQIHDDKPRNTRKTGIDGLYDQLLSEQIMYSSRPNVRLYPLEIHDNDVETNKLRETKHVRITSKCVQMIISESGLYNHHCH